MTNPPTASRAAQLAQIYQQAVAYHRNGMLREAEAQYKTILRTEPGHPASLRNLGAVRLQQGRADEAAKLIRRSLAVDPNAADAHYNLGMALLILNHPEEAVRHYEKALAIKPDYAEAHNNLGIVEMRLGQDDAARGHFEQALALRPRYAEAHSNLALHLMERQQHEAALAHIVTAVEIRPDNSDDRSAYGHLLARLGRADEARAQFEQAVALDPRNARARSNLLFCLNYFAEMTPEALFAAHREWGERHAPAPTPRERRPARARDAQRRLRVGYVSADFCTHSVAFFLAPLLAAHDRQHFEIVCFSDVIHPDATTGRFVAAADKWVEIGGQTDEAATGRIRAAAIDILVDLAGHTAGNRLGVFARKPAPVQFTWLGYPNTTGLAAIDYRITDAIADPPGAADQLHAETLLRLPRCFLCYGAPESGAPVSSLPAATAGRVTFGSFNNIAKITPQVIATWARVLLALPDALLSLKAQALVSPETRALVLAAFAAHGVAGDRIVIADWTKTTDEHLALYNAIDIALDTFPYNGTTTTCEALWMGVPVVTLAGDRHAARVGVSLLTAVGLPELVAANADAFVDLAVGLAQDRARLAALRAGLRERMQHSELCNATGFARAIETAFREAFERWRALP